MLGIDFIVYGIILTVALIGTTEFVIGLILLKEHDKQQKEEKNGGNIGYGELGGEKMSRYDDDIDKNPYLSEYGKYAIQFARNHGITVQEAYQSPTVKAYKEDLRHLAECFNFATGNMRLTDL